MEGDNPDTAADTGVDTSAETDEGVTVGDVPLPAFTTAASVSYLIVNADVSEPLASTVPLNVADVDVTTLAGDVTTSGNHAPNMRREEFPRVVRYVSIPDAVGAIPNGCESPDSGPETNCVGVASPVAFGEYVVTELPVLFATLTLPSLYPKMSVGPDNSVAPPLIVPDGGIGIPPKALDVESHLYTKLLSWLATNNTFDVVTEMPEGEAANPSSPFGSWFPSAVAATSHFETLFVPALATYKRPPVSTVMPCGEFRNVILPVIVRSGSASPLAPTAYTVMLPTPETPPVSFETYNSPVGPKVRYLGVDRPVELPLMVRTGA